MTVDAFKELMVCNEPDFTYKGEAYSISWPDGRYYVSASDSPADTDLVFASLDDLLNNWMIQGKPLRDILPEIEIG